MSLEFHTGRAGLPGPPSQTTKARSKAQGPKGSLGRSSVRLSSQSADDGLLFHQDPLAKAHRTGLFCITYPGHLSCSLISNQRCYLPQPVAWLSGTGSLSGNGSTYGVQVIHYKNEQAKNVPLLALSLIPFLP